MLKFNYPRFCFRYPGYGNIAPKTNMGKIVTLIYAMVGIPLFLMWVSQMGTFLAQLFTFIYHNICCVMCRSVAVCCVNPA